MEKSIITTGKTIDEAVETALAQLGLTRDDVTYQVISLPKSGFFGIGEEETSKCDALSGIPERPYCKGRAYDPDRYNR